MKSSRSGETNDGILLIMKQTEMIGHLIHRPKVDNHWHHICKTRRLKRNAKQKKN